MNQLRTRQDVSACGEAMTERLGGSQVVNHLDIESPCRDGLVKYFFLLYSQQNGVDSMTHNPQALGTYSGSYLRSSPFHS
jgi:hypothetical protein